jgi:predicted DNA-binding transcriptional regulator YafY
LGTNSDLNDWKKANRISVRVGQEPVGDRLLGSIKTGEFIHVYYHSGSNPGGDRLIAPRSLFRKHGYEANVYVEAYCDARKEVRIFRLDRLQLVEKIPRNPTKKNPEARSKAPSRSKSTSQNRQVDRSPAPAKRRSKAPQSPALQTLDHEQSFDDTNTSSGKWIFILAAIVALYLVFA